MAQSPQQQLIDVPATPVTRDDDFFGIWPGHIRPTGSCHFMERGGNILVIKSMPYRQGIAMGQSRMWKALTQFGSPVDAPGSVTVVCIWGLGQGMRSIVVYDHQGQGTQMDLTREQWRSWLLKWWNDAERR